MRYRMALLAAAVVVVAGAGAAGGSYAAITAITEPDGNGVITSCYNASGDVRLVDAGAACAAGETKLSWASNTPPKVHLVGAAGEPAYQNFWKAYGNPPFGNAAFYKDSSGVVHLTGLTCQKSFHNPSVCTTGILAGGTLPIFTLPVGFRPAHQLVFTTLSFASPEYLHTRIDVSFGGAVTVTAPPDTGEEWVSLDGISFLAK